MGSGGRFKLPEPQFPCIYTISPFSSVSWGVGPSQTMRLASHDTVSGAKGCESSREGPHSAVRVPVPGWSGRADAQHGSTSALSEIDGSHVKAAFCLQRFPAASLGARLVHNWEGVWEVGAPECSATGQLTYHLWGGGDSSRGTRETGTYRIPEG